MLTPTVIAKINQQAKSATPPNLDERFRTVETCFRGDQSRENRIAQLRAMQSDIGIFSSATPPGPTGADARVVLDLLRADVMREIKSLGGGS